MKNNVVLISPSIIACDLTTLGEKVREFDPSVIDLLHMDVMDGKFVPNLTFGPGYIAELKTKTSIPLDVHLMIERPEDSIAEYIKSRPWSITIHYESTRYPARVLSIIRKEGIIAGISLNPATPVESLYDLLPYADMVLIMSVDPGFYGQSFMEPALDRIRKLSEYIVSREFDNIRIQVDGGINSDNILKVVQAGARIVVAGNSAFKGGDVNKNVTQLKKCAMGFH